jgi:simple sugar transport system substrate-binding protein
MYRSFRRVATPPKLDYHNGMGKKPAAVRSLLLLALLALSCAGCAKAAKDTATDVATTGGADAVSAATAAKGPSPRELLEGFMPGAMADGVVKIAMLVNQGEGDSSRQFIEGGVTEGRAMGFTVDSFVTGRDENRCRDFAAGIANADYDGVVFAHGGVDFSYDILKPIGDRGVPIVTFEALPYRDGRSIKGLITTFQDDYSLARLSLETLLSYSEGGESRPARVIRVGCDLGITFLDRRAWEFGQFVRRGRIEEVAFVRLDGLENPRAAAWEALAAILPRFPPGSADAVWVPWDEFAIGCAEALAAAERRDIKLISIDVSNEDMRLMQRHQGIWMASTAVDPKIAGTVTMRLLAAALAGETLKETFSFSPQLVKTADLNQAVNIANISMMVPGWGDGKGLFDHYQWMIDLKAAEGNHPRIPPLAANPAAP